ncbi:cytochrome P450 [Apiospora phragmitis]|uniref:Cytochrome P450 n=1 Tax=Apiospora phragmitis TaxID=2905665 RepID=A0ABR1T9I4_9PEZI
MGVGPAGNAIIGSERMLENDSYLSTFVPRPYLLALASMLLAVRRFDASLSLSARLSADKSTTVELFAWVCREIFLATTNSIYGPMNPFRDPRVEQAWYDFEPGIMVHMLKAWPGMLARKSLRAREQRLIPAFEKYFAANGHLQGSLLVQCRYKHNTGHGLRGRDVAATEVGQMRLKCVMDALPYLLRLHGSLRVPQRGRQLLRTENDGVRTIDLAKVKSSCPSCCRCGRDLRYVYIGIAARVVMQDTTLDGRWLLKKGSTAMTVAPRSAHRPVRVGPDGEELPPSALSAGPRREAPNPVTIRSFGGGTVFFPGRHFVNNEVMAFAALLLRRFDLKPTSGNGEWADPGRTFP